jgi:hypothetical protein
LEPARRGSDWLDGALAGWLLVSAAQTLGAVGGRGVLPALGALVIAGALAGAVIPVLRFRRFGWSLAVAGIVAHGLATLAGGTGGAGGARAAALLLPDLLALVYLALVRPDFGLPDLSVQGWRTPFAPRGTAIETASPAPLPAAPPPAPDPAGALAAIHRRIVAAGSACALRTGEAMAEAERHGVDRGRLRAAGIELYGTFLRHFASEGRLEDRHERELACLAATLELDPGRVADLRADVLTRRAPPPAPRSPARAPAPAMRARATDDVLAAADVELFRVTDAPPGEPGHGVRRTGTTRGPSGLARRGRCRLLLTGRALVLESASGARSPLPLDRLAAATVYGNGLEIRTGDGTLLFLRFTAGAAAFATSLERALTRREPGPGMP